MEDGLAQTHVPIVPNMMTASRLFSQTVKSPAEGASLEGP